MNFLNNLKDSACYTINSWFDKDTQPMNTTPPKNQKKRNLPYDSSTWVDREAHRMPPRKKLKSTKHFDNFEKERLLNDNSDMLNNHKHHNKVGEFEQQLRAPPPQRHQLTPTQPHPKSPPQNHAKSTKKDEEPKVKRAVLFFCACVFM